MEANVHGVFGDRMQGSCTNEENLTMKAGGLEPALEPWKLLSFKCLNMDSPCF